MRLPRKGTKKYIAVVTAGCLGKWFDICDYGEEFDCDSDYDWTCDECPVNEEARRNGDEG